MVESSTEGRVSSRANAESRYRGEKIERVKSGIYSEKIERSKDETEKSIGESRPGVTTVQGNKKREPADGIG